MASTFTHSSKIRLILASCLAVIGLHAGIAQAEEEYSWDIRFNPLFLIVGGYELEANIRVADNISVGPMFTYWNFVPDNSSNSLTIMKYGVRANWHLNKVFADGVYLSGYYVRDNASVVSSETVFNNKTLASEKVTYTGSASANTFGALIGYQWEWDTVNFNFGVGRKFSQLADIKVSSSDGQTKNAGTSNSTSGSFSMDFSLGYAF